jgi:hypothetical protein
MMQTHLRMLEMAEEAREPVANRQTLEVQDRLHQVDARIAMLEAGLTQTYRTVQHAAGACLEHIATLATRLPM